MLSPELFRALVCLWFCSIMGRRHGIAVFGVGRAGTIHLRNVIANHRCRLLYLVDVNQRRMMELAEEYNLGEGVKTVTPEEKETVLKDPA
jgi:myo-inositol 2-dehydrogenase/D-chiro-inositol 1-dehydrogenase